MGIGTAIGAGIFVTAGQVAVFAGPGVIARFVIAGCACALAGMCYAGFAALAPTGGSAYSYAYSTMGDLLAWIIGRYLVLEYPFAGSIVAVEWSLHLVALLDAMGVQVSQRLVGLEVGPAVGSRSEWRGLPVDHRACQPPRGVHHRGRDGRSHSGSRGERPRQRDHGHREGRRRPARHLRRRVVRRPGELGQPAAPRARGLPPQRLCRGDDRRGDGVLFLHRVRRGLHARGRDSRPRAKLAHRDSRVARHLHGAVSRGRDRADRMVPWPQMALQRRW